MHGGKWALEQPSRALRRRSMPLGADFKPILAICDLASSCNLAAVFSWGFPLLNVNGDEIPKEKSWRKGRVYTVNVHYSPPGAVISPNVYMHMLLLRRAQCSENISRNTCKCIAFTQQNLKPPLPSNCSLWTGTSLDFLSYNLSPVGTPLEVSTRTFFFAKGMTTVSISWRSTQHHLSNVTASSWRAVITLCILEAVAVNRSTRLP